MDPRKGLLRAGVLTMPCALGRSGTSIFKREGDGATPVAAMTLLSALRRPGYRLPLALSLPMRVARADDGWCDAPAHPAYNRAVRLPFAASAETMIRQDRLYDLVVVLDWNVRARRRGAGSAIFLHVAKPGYRPTQGCVAVSPADMARLAPFLRRGTRLRVHR
ncbi:L,D-transpeptidase family protein [Aureimonas populi]|uniref:L,D-transpeptidase n=1 Tax=Aureimonas populi TaxID=1701758 RepID=A0ABW5CI52_9HYPH|nr:L,D-transpeptidase family protein [Aureimonas populi]